MSLFLGCGALLARSCNREWTRSDHSPPDINASFAVYDEVGGSHCHDAPEEGRQEDRCRCSAGLRRKEERDYRVGT